ncbi:MAG TPA: hypothetical protein VJO14_07375 [Bacteroidota bacterium]|nr:hypothetical protein [Bacteroidota bacterium]
MALLEDEPTYTGRKLLLIGFPALLIAVAISLVAHQEAHRVGLSTFCSGTTGFATPVRSLGGIENRSDGCGMSALAGQLTTLGLGVLSFALLLRYPRNLFFISMAFVNATARLPETITVFLQYLIHNGTSLRVDESVSLTLFGLTDPTIPTVIMCFYSLVLLFFAIIVVHDVRSVRYKWPIAFALFAFMGYIEYGVMWAIAPIVTG